MKRLSLLITLFLSFSPLLFSGEYFYQFTDTDEFYYQQDKIDLTEAQFFCKNNNLPRRYSIFHDTKIDKYYLVVRDKEDKLYYLFNVREGKVYIKEYIKIEMQDRSVLLGIDDNKVLFLNGKGETRGDYLIYDLKTKEIQTFLVKEPDKWRLFVSAFKNNKIFYEKKGYFDIQKNQFIFYPIELNYISVGDNGDKIAGINDKSYIIILDLQTEEQKNTKIKRKSYFYTENYTEGKLKLRKDVLYFSKKRIGVFDYFEALVFVYATEKHQWYKMDLKTGRKKKIKQPSRIAEMI